MQIHKLVPQVFNKHNTPGANLFDVIDQTLAELNGMGIPNQRALQWLDMSINRAHRTLPHTIKTKTEHTLSSGYRGRGLVYLDVTIPPGTPVIHSVAINFKHTRWQVHTIVYTHTIKYKKDNVTYEKSTNVTKTREVESV